jgi:putative Mg2+ transporter-C (MgtC) family protein
MAPIIEGLISGVGFIGGGAILKDGNSVRGTATAASPWATGAIGASVGLGVYDVAITVSLITFATLRFLAPLKSEIAPHPIAPSRKKEGVRGTRSPGGAWAQHVAIRP